MALNIPCGVRPDCEDETPLTNLTSEAPDQEVFVSTYFPPVDPPLGRSYTATGCGVTCTAATQESADFCAEQAAQICSNEPPPVNPPPPDTPGGPGDDGGGGGPFTPPPPLPPPPSGTVVPSNTAQTCCYTCPDGSQFCYTVAAGLFYGATQAVADSIAHSFGCQKAQQLSVCLTGTADGACLGEPLSFIVSAVGGTAPFTWSIVSGSLPNGVSGITQVNSRQFLISGTPTAAGNTTIVVRATDAIGNFMQKTFTIAVMEITSGAPPNGEMEVPYSFQFTASGGIPSLTWSLASGTLPAGLTLSSAGLLSGTPTTPQTYNFTVRVSDSGSASCTRACTVDIESGADCPLIISTLGIGVFKQPFAYDPVQDALFFPKYNTNEIVRLNPQTNLVDGNASGSWFPGAAIYVPPYELTKETTAPFVAPAIGDDVQIALNNVILVAVGQILTIEGKNYEVLSRDGGNLITIENLNDTMGNNVPAGEDVIVDFTGGILFQASETVSVSGAIYYLNPDTLAVTRVVSLAGAPSSNPPMIYIPGSDTVWVGSNLSNGFDVFNILTGSIVNVPGTQNVIGFAYNESAGEVYVSGLNNLGVTLAKNESTFVTTKTYSVTLPPGFETFEFAAWNIVYCPTNDRLYVAYNCHIDEDAIEQSVIDIVNATTFILLSRISLLQTIGDEHAFPVPQPAYSSSQDLMYFGYGTLTEPAFTAIVDPATNNIICTLDTCMGLGVECLSKDTFYSKDFDNFSDVVETGL